MRWSITKLVAAGGIGVFIFITSLVGSLAAAATGLVGTEAFINVFIVPIGMVFGMLLLPQFGTQTLMTLVFSLLALPLPSYGPPGFLPKVFIGVLAAVLADASFVALRPWLTPKRAALVAAGPINNILAGAGYLAMVFLFPATGLASGFEWAVSSWFVMLLLSIGLGSIAGLIGGGIGWVLFKKLERTAVVGRIQQSP